MTTREEKMQMFQEVSSKLATKMFTLLAVKEEVCLSEKKLSDAVNDYVQKTMGLASKEDDSIIDTHIRVMRSQSEVMDNDKYMSFTEELLDVLADVLTGARK